MNEQAINIVNNIYKEMNNNIDIISLWFSYSGLKLNQDKLFEYKRMNFSPIIGNENDIYLFINKMINNILIGRPCQLNNLNYLESNFISLANIVMNEYMSKINEGGAA